MSLQPGRLIRELPGARGGEPVVPAQPPVHDLLPVHRDQLVRAQPVQGGVQGPGAQPDLVPLEYSIEWLTCTIPDRLDGGDDWLGGCSRSSTC